MKKVIRSTLFKNIVFYIIFLSIAIVGMYTIIYFYFGRQYSTMYNEQVADQTEVLALNTSDMFLDIQSTCNQFNSDAELIVSRYDNRNYSNYVIVDEIRKIAKTDELVKDIILIDYRNDSVYTSHYYCKLDEMNNLEIKDTQGSVSIPTSYVTSFDTHNELAYFTSDDSEMLLFTPEQSSLNNKMLVVIEKKTLEDYIEQEVSGGIGSITLKTENNVDIVTQTHSIANEYSKTYIAETDYANLYYEISYNENYLTDVIDEVFVTAYFFVGIIAVLGIIFAVISVRINYSPIYSLTKRLTDNKDFLKDDILELNNVFEKEKRTAELLSNRVSIYKKMIIDSIKNSDVFSKESAMLPNDFDDKFFNNSNPVIVVMRIFFTQTNSKDDINTSLFTLTNNIEVSTYALESNEESSVYILTWDEMQKNVDSNLQKLLKSIISEYNCKIAMSDYSSNPIDITKLYYNANTAATFLSDTLPLIGYDNITESSSLQSASIKDDTRIIFDKFSTAIAQLNFNEAKTTLLSLFDSIDSHIKSEVIIRVILTDITVVLGSVINNYGVKNKNCNDLFSKTLVLCRNIKYLNDKTAIQDSLISLLTLVLDEVSKMPIQSVHIEKFIKDNCFDANFSIAILADEFFISVAYMSFLFKKQFNKNFSDYLWNLRYEKAIQLLAETEYSIDEISQMVGYTKASSFRRKFKEETGFTPSQYRSDRHLAE